MHDLGHDPWSISVGQGNTDLFTLLRLNWRRCEPTGRVPIPSHFCRCYLLAATIGSASELDREEYSNGTCVGRSRYIEECGAAQRTIIGETESHTCVDVLIACSFDNLCFSLFLSEFTTNPGILYCAGI